MRYLLFVAIPFGTGCQAAGAALFPVNFARSIVHRAGAPYTPAVLPAVEHVAPTRRHLARKLQHQIPDKRRTGGL